MAVVTMMMGMVRGERERRREEGDEEGVVAREAIIYHMCHYPLNATMYSDLGGNVD
jgi:hypothetical protein